MLFRKSNVFTLSAKSKIFLMFLAVFPNKEDTIASNLAMTKGNPVSRAIFFAILVSATSSNEIPGFKKP